MGEPTTVWISIYDEQVLRDIESWVRSRGANVSVRGKTPQRAYFILVIYGDVSKLFKED